VSALVRGLLHAMGEMFSQRVRADLRLRATAAREFRQRGSQQALDVARFASIALQDLCLGSADLTLTKTKATQGDESRSRARARPSQPEFRPATGSRRHRTLRRQHAERQPPQKPCRDRQRSAMHDPVVHRAKLEGAASARARRTLVAGAEAGATRPVGAFVRVCGFVTVASAGSFASEQ
jgi:hypothetical protein